MQPKAGRLDLLLQDADTYKRYEVELQLGATDESHIIRTIEYWDLERKRYPQYDHCAVIIAEDITSRFLNIISLFNGHVPLIALQMSAIKIGDNVGLNFVKVFDEMSFGLIDADEEVNMVSDRDYWLKRGTKKTVEEVDQIIEVIQSFAPDYRVKYNKFYIGLMKNGVANNFVACKPKKQFVRVEIRLSENIELASELENAGVEVEFHANWGKYLLRINSGETIEKAEVLKKIFFEAYKQSES